MASEATEMIILGKQQECHKNCIILRNGYSLYHYHETSARWALGTFPPCFFLGVRFPYLKRRGEDVAVEDDEDGVDGDGDAVDDLLDETVAAAGTERAGEPAGVEGAQVLAGLHLHTNLQFQCVLSHLSFCA